MLNSTLPGKLSQRKSEANPGCKDGGGGYCAHTDLNLAPCFGLCLSKMDEFSTKSAFSAFSSPRW